MSIGEASIAEGARGFAASALRGIKNVLLPPLCPACHARIDVAHRLCGACWQTIAFITEPYCDRLGIPMPYAVGEKQLSPAAIARPPAYDRARAAAHYQGAMRDLVHALKYGDRQDGVDLMVGWLAHAGRELLADADVLAPAPLHRARLWSRRFNQAALLSGRLAALKGVPHAPFVLERIRATKSQVGMTKDQRRRNVRGAFRVAQREALSVKGRNVVLIDDVLTTGATAEACARALKRGGARRVDVLVLALAGHGGAA